MPKGGARARSGPPPDPHALRRDRDASTWTRLPSHREGDPPAFPLARPTRRERTVWARLWTRAQAVMWEALELEDQVAMYVRALVAAEDRGASVAARTLLLRQEESLGLSPAGLARNRWIIAADDGPAAVVGDPEEDGAGADVPPGPRRRRSSGPNAKERLRDRGLGVLDGGA